MTLLGSTHNPSHEDPVFHTPATQYERIVHDIISDEQSDIFRLVNFVALCQVISLFGIFTNIANMIVFYKQGFNTTTNISFFALAISDMSCLITTEWYGICLNPYFDTDEIPFIAKEVQYLSGGWLHVSYGRITSWITVFITAERCIGIAWPLKVKQIITLRLTTVCMIVIFVINIGILLPEYCIMYWGWKFVPARNRSFIGFIYRSFKDEGKGLVYAMTSVSGIMSFVAVICLTIFLVTKLAQKSQWRKKATGGSENSEAISTRDKKTMKMIVMIASVLIVCYIPGTTLSLATAFEGDFMISAQLENSFFSFWSIAFVFDSINSSVNLFVYYNMSTKYRQTFNEVFARCMKSNPEPSTTSANPAGGNAPRIQTNTT